MYKNLSDKCGKRLHVKPLLQRGAIKNPLLFAAGFSLPLLLVAVLYALPFHTEGGFSEGGSTKADLVITAFDMPDGETGDTITAYVTVKNIGTQSTAGSRWRDSSAGGFEIAINGGTVLSTGNMDCDTTKHASVQTSALGAGESRTVAISGLLWYGIEGTYTATAMADSDCQIGETDETNNTKTDTYTIIFISEQHKKILAAMADIEESLAEIVSFSMEEMVRDIIETTLLEQAIEDALAEIEYLMLDEAVLESIQDVLDDASIQQAITDAGYSLDAVTEAALLDGTLQEVLSDPDVALALDGALDQVLDQTAIEDALNQIINTQAVQDDISTLFASMGPDVLDGALDVAYADPTMAALLNDPNVSPKQLEAALQDVLTVETLTPVVQNEMAEAILAAGEPAEVMESILGDVTNEALNSVLGADLQEALGQALTLDVDTLVNDAFLGTATDIFDSTVSDTLSTVSGGLIDASLDDFTSGAAFENLVEDSFTNLADSALQSTLGTTFSSLGITDITSITDPAVITSFVENTAEQLTTGLITTTSGGLLGATVFGGQVSSVILCDCSKGRIISVGPPRPHPALYIVPGKGVHEYKYAYPDVGNWVLGRHDNVPGVCWKKSGKRCATIPYTASAVLIGSSR